MANQTIITFNDVSNSDRVDGKFDLDGVTVWNGDPDCGFRPDPDHPATIFDTANPTGGDTDLAFDGRGGALIAQETVGREPDDNAHGADFVFAFDTPSDVHSLTFLDIEEGACVRVYDADGCFVKSVNIAPTADNGARDVDLNLQDVGFLIVSLPGSGAVDDVVFTKGAQPDGVVDGTAAGELIDLTYVDAQGDRIDANDAVGVEGTTGDEDLVLAGGGNDTVYAGVGDDIVRGEGGHDRLFGEGGDDVLQGGSGNDQLSGGDGDDTIEGGDGCDTVYGGDGADVIDGGAHADRIEGRAGADSIEGGDGNDTIVGYDAKSINSGDVTAAEDDGSDDTLSGGAGHDKVFGGAGDDLIAGGAGADTLDGGDDRDIFIEISPGDVIDGGEGGDDFDELDLTGLDVEVEFDEDNDENGTIFFLDEDGERTGETARFINIENVFDDSGPIGPNALDGIVDGTDGADLIDIDYTGDPEGDRVDAGDAILPGEVGDDDIIRAGDGDDTVLAGEGDDEVEAGDGNDSVEGGAGDDLLRGGIGDDIVNGGDGDDTIGGGSGQDTLDGGAGNDSVRGGTQDDTVFGGSGDDTVTGGGGDDLVRGGEGNDIVRGGGENDTLFGDEGDDTLTAAGGVNEVYGGDDRDTIIGITPGSSVDGGEGGDDFDSLDLSGLNVEVEFDPDNEENGTVFFLDGDGNRTGESAQFINIENLFNERGPIQPDDLDDELDGLVEGTEDADLIDIDYTGDPEGDRVDAGDAILDGEVGDDDIILAGGGDDTVLAGEGDDEVEAGDGDDSVEGGAGDDEVLGGAGADTIDGGDGGDTILGGDGNDVITSGARGTSDLGYPGIITPDADPENDRDSVDGGAGDDSIFTGDDRDTVTGGTGADTIDAGKDDDLVDAGSEDDLVVGGEGSDTISGGDGDDTIYAGLDPSFPDAINIPDDEGDLVTDNGRDIVDGGGGNDLIFGQDDDDTLFGGDGDDTLDGGIDDDSLSGGDGNDSLLGGDGDDTIDGGEGADTIEAGAGNDLVDGGRGDDLIDGGDGDDTIRGSFGNDTVDGGAGNDSVSGSNNDDLLRGGDGDDTISGSSGRDTLEGGAGNDRMLGGNQADTVLGGDGDDTISGADGADLLDGGAGNDSIRGGADGDTIFGGDDDDRIESGGGNDVVTGGDGADTIQTGDDRDLIIGGSAGDSVDGGSGGEDQDTLDLTGSDVDFITYTSDDREDGVVTFNDGSTMEFEEIETVIPCFTPGTMIATPRGEVPVEDLKVGDRVITRDNGIQVIRWTGRKQLHSFELFSKSQLCPVMIAKGALGHGLPERDMVVSPQHRVLMSSEDTELYFEEREVLVAAKHMVGRPGIERLKAQDVTYIHIMFDNHEVILSDGAWTESFQPGECSLRGLGRDQAEEIYAIFPELRNNHGLEVYPAARRMLKRREAEMLR